MSRHPVLLVGGFLGCGKTSFLRALIRELRIREPARPILLIENDFGNVSFDAALLRREQVTVSELSQGCICCSLSGDFSRALRLAASENPDALVLIEPSGVGRLSQIVAALKSPDLVEHGFELIGALCLLDARHFFKYLENFDTFYEDQIKLANLLLVNQLENIQKPQLDAIFQSLRELNPQATCHLIDARKPDPDLLARCAESLLRGRFFPIQAAQTSDCEERPLTSSARNGLEKQGLRPISLSKVPPKPVLSSEERFYRFSWQLTAPCPPARIRQIFQQVEMDWPGLVLRAKGEILLLGPGPGGRLSPSPTRLQYTPGQLQLSRFTPDSRINNSLGFICSADPSPLRAFLRRPPEPRR